MQFDSLEFYRDHARRYSELSHEFIHSVYSDCSHPALHDDLDLLNRVVALAPGIRGLDAGCGAGARDVHLLHSKGCDVYGIDAVEENISLGKELHPEITDKLSVADLREPLAFDSASLDFVLCNAVIQHLAPDIVEHKTIPELVRILIPGGVLQLMFKVGSGVTTVGDRYYGSGMDRCFKLYDESRLLNILEDCGCSLVEAVESEELSGMLYFSDYKPMRYCAFWVRKI